MYSHGSWYSLYLVIDGSSLQTNGQVERFNSTMDAKSASLSNQSHSDWDDQLPFVTLNYNTSIHATTKSIPFELMYGRSPMLPCDPQNPIVSLQSDLHDVAKLHQHVTSLSRTAHDNVSLAQASSKVRYDEHRSDPSYQANDIMLIRNLRRRYKFDVRFEGPYRVVRRTDHKTYVVQHVHLHHIVRTVTVDSIASLFARSLIQPLHIFSISSASYFFLSREPSLISRFIRQRFFASVFLILVSSSVLCAYGSLY